MNVEKKYFIDKVRLKNEELMKINESVRNHTGVPSEQQLRNVQ